MSSGFSGGRSEAGENISDRYKIGGAETILETVKISEAGEIF